MQNLLDKVLSSKETQFQDKKKLLERVIATLKTPDQKATLLKTILESLLNQHYVSIRIFPPSDSLWYTIQDYPHRTELICEMLANLTSLDMDFMDIDTHLDFLRDAPELELTISWISHILRKPVDKSIMNSLKTIWVKKLNKLDAYWHCHYFKDLITYKEKQLKQQESKQQSMQSEEPVKLPPSLQFFNHQTFFYRIKIIFDFMIMNQSFPTHGIDLREVRDLPFCGIKAYSIRIGVYIMAANAKSKYSRINKFCWKFSSAHNWHQREIEQSLHPLFQSRFSSDKIPIYSRGCASASL